jgi:xylulokinase
VGCILTFDIGTTAIKTSLFDEGLELLAQVGEEYGLKTGAGNLVELDCSRYWEGMLSGTAKLGVALAGGSRAAALSQVAAIAVTTQGETLVPVDAQGDALRDAIVWLDGRAVEQAARINERFPPRDFYRVTGLPEVSAATPVAKLLWIKEREPELFRKTASFLLLEDYILMRLTGRRASEPSLLSSSGYYDISRDRYCDEVLDFIGIGKELLPEVLECGSPVGRILPEAAVALGINPSALVLTAAMDQTASAVAAGNLAPGVVSETTGTALVIAATVRKPDFEHPNRPTLYRHALRGEFLVIPICMTAGILLKWFRDEFCPDIVAACAASGKDSYDELCELASRVPAGSGGLVLLPYFTGLINPEVNGAAKGVLFGLGLDTGRNHHIRAILESVAFMLRENLELIESTGVRIDEVRSLGGGSKNAIWLRIKAEACSLPIASMRHSECASLGAAMLAATSLGWYPDLGTAAASANAVASRFEPTGADAAAYEGAYRKYRELYRLVRPLFES